MRKVDAGLITQAVARLCVLANTNLPEDVRQCINAHRAAEDWPAAASALDQIIKNYQLAQAESIPICQDTGVVCVFLEIGQEVQIVGDLNQAVNEGVRIGYKNGYLRGSVVRDPLDRVNTKDNTPAMIYLELVPGSEIHLNVAPKGFGSENMSRIKMLKPSDGVEGVKEFVLETIELAGPNPCPPIVVGVGVGGSFDKSALLAKKALMRPLDKRHEQPSYAALECELLEAINALGIGPQGFGGRTTALAVNIEYAPTHIASLPCAVNLNCHVARHSHEVI